uniref:Large subunit ribosomal protein 23 n=1 Tax=Plasmodium malariae TaxID=5858 RepID=H7CDE4_PLAMA|nr:large subunit ribosomal protein 23 [Plasmodium malariae]
MKEIILNYYLNCIFYKINFVNRKYYIIYSKIFLTKFNIKYLIKNIFKIDIYKIKIIIDKKKLLKKYYILLK